MNARVFPLAAALLAAVLVSPSALWPQTAPGAPRLSRAEMEEFLLHAKVIRTRTVSTGVTGSQRATLTDGKLTHDAHIQSIDISRQEFRSDRDVELNFRDSYKFNIAAYRLGLLLGIENIPVSVERKVAGKTSAVTWWVDDVLMDEAARHAKNIPAPDPERWNREMHVVRVFDQLIYNTDRNLRNLLITKNWELEMIDHTRAFRIRTDLREPRNLRQCDRALLKRLQALNRDEMLRQLRPLLTRREIDAVLARRDKIVDLFQAAIREKGEGAVLYDLK